MKPRDVALMSLHALQRYPLRTKSDTSKLMRAVKAALQRERGRPARS